jgi:hypothetical protein
LLEVLQLREAPSALPVPQQLAIEKDCEDAAASWAQGDLSELLFEGGQQLLSSPCCSHHPLAASAVVDRDAMGAARQRAVLREGL